MFIKFQPGIPNQSGDQKQDNQHEFHVQHPLNGNGQDQTDNPANAGHVVTDLPAPAYQCTSQDDHGGSVEKDRKDHRGTGSLQNESSGEIQEGDDEQGYAAFG